MVGKNTNIDIKADKSNQQEEGQQQWTTFSDISIWFDSCEKLR